VAAAFFSSTCIPQTGSFADMLVASSRVTGSR
jgi:hypothetical protein